MKQLSDCRVLLVDDAKANIDILVAALKNEYKLSVALNGEMALQFAERTPPDLVLLDIMMPGLDGYEVCRRFRKMPAMADVPVIFLSSLDEVQNKAQGFEAGANDYVTKPFEALEVQARVRSLLKAKAYSDSVKEQLAADMRVAHDIQMGMIPQDFSALEKQFGVELAATLVPTREVGGDLYCAFAADDERLVLTMGDVSGKGIPASLFMVRASTLVRLLGRQIREPAAILAKLNDELEADNPSCMFVTLLFAIYERTSRRLTLASAGHCRPVLLRRRAAARLGLFQARHRARPGGGHEVRADRAYFAAGRRLRSLHRWRERGLQFGARMLRRRAPARRACHLHGQAGAGHHGFLAAKRARPCRCHSAIRRHRHPRAPHPRCPGRNRHVRESTLELPATPEDVMRGVGYLEHFCAEMHVPPKAIQALMLAVEEMASNIVNHAYRRDARQTFRLTLQHHGDRIIVELRDHGPAFDPLQAAAPDLETDPDERDSGGLGIHLVRHYIEDLHYAREGGENVLRMTKLLPPAH